MNRKGNKIKILKSVLFGIILIHLFSGGGIIFCQSAKEHADSLVKQATYESKKGNHLMAFQYINKAIGIQPNRLDLYYKRAFIFGRAGNYAKAIKEFSLLSSRGNFPHAVRFRADCYLAIGQYERAAKDYLNFLKRDPKDGKVWSYLVEAFALMGNSKAAIEASQKGLATRSHWSKRLRNLQEKILTGKPINPHKPLSN